MQTLNSLSEIFDRYDAFLCDLWGVIHDGEYLYPQVLEALEALHEAGKQVMFLSNAPRSADSVIQKMNSMGVRREWYLGALTSGEAARRYLLDIPKYAVSENKFLLGSYYYQGLESDAAILDGLPQQRVSSVEEADFILGGNFDYHGQPMDEIRPKLERALARNLPMLCINPDLEVIKQDGTQIFCAGFLASEYEKLGGTVGYIGKPHPLVYDFALEELSSHVASLREGNADEAIQSGLPRSRWSLAMTEAGGEVNRSRIAMIGDNLLTDIKGGKAAGIGTILVTQGVLAGKEVAPLCQEYGISPDYVIGALK